jgi:hypothetical protein
MSQSIIPWSKIVAIFTVPLGGVLGSFTAPVSCARRTDSRVVGSLLDVQAEDLSYSLTRDTVQDRCR